MATCRLCLNPIVNLADAMLLAGDSHAAVARAAGLDRQTVGRHVRNNHVRKPKAEDIGWTPGAIGQDEWVSIGARRALGRLTEAEWVRVVARHFEVPLADLQDHIAAGHHLA